MKSEIYRSASRVAVLLKKLAARMNCITRIAHGMEQRCFKGLVDLRPQSADVRFDNGTLRVEIEVPYPLKEHCPRQHPTLIAHQEFQERELPRKQVDVLSGPSGAPLDQVQLKVSHSESGLFSGNRRAADQRVDTGG